MDCIDDYWKDDVIYYVEFITMDNKKVSKAIVLSMNYSTDEVKNIVLQKFYNVKRISHLDIWEDCLSLK
ncbi:hypothetical protein [Carnobacterium maltaromaticum]|uniref:hypothetical protein n=1 Tax=Carnobacterium maltaromaticum TaxID=2751 RepID=UPI00295F2B02|nr:hypothetical protein [Carnobacterium maltaromaticum]